MNEVDKIQKGLKRDFERKIRALREKAEEFRAKGDYERAEKLPLFGPISERVLAEYEG